MRYGKVDYQFKSQKILITDLKVNESIFYNNFYFQLKIEKEKQQLILQIYDKSHSLIEEEAYIDFTSLKTKLDFKIKKLALIKASKKKIGEEQYHRYYKISIYEIISFDKFIDLLAKDIIRTRLELRISRSGPEKGRQRNKNLMFLIDEKDITLLYKTLYKYNHDINLNH